MSDAGREMTLEAFVQRLAEPARPEDDWRPWLVRLAPGQGDELRAACVAAGIEAMDPIDGQLSELSWVRHPRTESAAARDGFAADAVAQAGDADAVGAWALFPWNRRIVHLLGRDDFFDVITNRNQDKITREEQVRLRERRVGVVGLSVGAEIAVAVAQEHLCGTLVLADFDRLELSNLNRLGGGVDDLGVNKAHLVARRVAKIDPYLRVEVYDAGVTAANVDRFLHRLDLLIEECDGLPLKYALRQRARERGLDVLFAADERGMFSVEPYSRYPQLEPFHGIVSGPPAPPEAFAGKREFMRSLTGWLGGWERISERSRRSVERIGSDLCGYPQLASEPRLAAGQVAHAARRLLLGDLLAPYFGYYDLDEILPVDAR